MAERLSGVAKKTKGSKAKDDLPPGDNRRAILEAEQAQALSFVGRIIPKMKEADVIKAELALKQEEISELFTLARAAGFATTLLKEIIKDLQVKGQRRSVRQDEAKRARVRRYFGLPVAEEEEQQELMPEEVRDASDWRAEGYKAGVRGDACENPKEMPTRHTQVFAEGWGDGQSALIKALAAPVPATPAPGPADGFEATPEELAAQSGRRQPEDEGAEAEDEEGEAVG